MPIKINKLIHYKNADNTYLQVNHATASIKNNSISGLV
jgi:hypothetical protein